MKNYELNHNQGFPFALDDIANHNNNDSLMASVLVKLITAEMNSPVLVSGLEINQLGNDTTDLKDGLVIYQSKLYKVNGGNLPGQLTTADVNLVVDNSEDVSVVWGDGQSRQSITCDCMKVATVGGTPLSNFRPYVAEAEPTGDITTLPDELPPAIKRVGNRVHLYGQVTYNNTNFELKVANAREFAPVGVFSNPNVFEGGFMAGGYGVDTNAQVPLAATVSYDRGTDELTISFGNTDFEKYSLNGISYIADV